MVQIVIQPHYQIAYARMDTMMIKYKLIVNHVLISVLHVQEMPRNAYLVLGKYIYFFGILNNINNF